ncbi:Ribonuclease H-like superfamily [Arabidopsis suecica]|uniref:Ribonuclease H-like superfamily n=1 Tax=Arabidopsis suecica TaxID=45249 RepID=A0A8T2AHU9_ARASU|nr:Ribonuclease H-like superfamily [Arabidopsis suecica]
MATALLFQSIHETLVLQVGEHDTSKKVWNAIKVRHVGAERVKEARLQTLMDEFDRLKMKDSEKIDDFAGKLSEISSKSAALFIHIIASLEQVLDLNTTGFEDIVGRLKVYEERVFEEEDSQEEQSKLMYANTVNQSYQENRDYNGDFRGRGRGGRFNNRGRGRGSNYETNTGEEDVWYLDNGASNHMTGDKRYFNKIDESVTGKVRFGADSRIDIKGKGSISFTNMNGEPRLMNDVYYIPDLKSNIISLGQATESGCDIRMKGSHLTMHDNNGKLLVKAERSKNRLYKVRMGLRNNTRLYLTTISESSRWHARLGHVNLETIKSMIQRELGNGIPHVTFKKEVCGSCLLGKQARRVFPQATSYQETKELELIHGDLCGPITPSTSAGNRYIFVLIDDYSRYMWTILLKEKGDAFVKFKNFKQLVEQESGASIKTFRTDRGGEFVSQEFNAFCNDSGIQRHLTAPYTPQQNGVVERRNRTLMEMARSIMKHMNVPNYLWGEAIRHFTYLLNRIATRALKDKTPYEMFRNKKPKIDHLRIFGCIGFAKIEKLHLKNL